MSVQNEISKAVILSSHGVFDIEAHMKTAIANELARKLLDDKAHFIRTIEGESTNAENVIVRAYVVAMTIEEAEAVIMEAYQAGINSKDTPE